MIDELRQVMQEGCGNWRSPLVFNVLFYTEFPTEIRPYVWHERHERHCFSTSSGVRVTPMA
jgi:hypothetical protein